MPLALLGGALVGLVNGVLVAMIGIPSFIATLATQFFWAGMATVLSGGKSYALRDADEYSVWQLLVGDLGGVPVARPSGRLDGGGRALVRPQPPPLRRAPAVHRRQRRVARVVGIDVEREKIKLFTLMGGLGGLAAMLLTLENKNFFGNQGQGYLLTAIASVLIGGTSIFGGRATIVGTVFGCFIIGMIEAGLVATGLTGAWVRTVQGLVFLVAIIFYLLVEEPQRRVLERAGGASACVRRSD